MVMVVIMMEKRLQLRGEQVVKHRPQQVVVELVKVVRVQLIQVLVQELPVQQ